MSPILAICTRSSSGSPRPLNRLARCAASGSQASIALSRKGIRRGSSAGSTARVRARTAAWSSTTARRGPDAGRDCGIGGAVAGMVVIGAPGAGLVGSSARPCLEHHHDPRPARPGRRAVHGPYPGASVANTTRRTESKVLGAGGGGPCPWPRSTGDAEGQIGWEDAMVRLGVVKEFEPGERRVATVPAVLPKLLGLGFEVLVEHDAGVGVFQPDSAYAQAGATVVDAATLDAQADVLLCVGPPGPERVARLRRGQVLVGLLNAAGNAELVATLAERGVTAVSLELLPRTLSRAQSMDALTSQANVAGYKAAILAA